MELIFQLTFSANRLRVTLDRFPPISTEEAEVFWGATNSTTITMVGTSNGTFEPSSGNLTMPIELFFDNSHRYAGDARGSFNLTTQTAISPSGVFDLTGAPLNQRSRQIRLVGASRFVASGGGPVDELGGRDVSIEIEGTLTPLP